jgi:thiamine-phosphate pyrophosphorylase
MGILCRHGENGAWRRKFPWLWPTRRFSQRRKSGHEGPMSRTCGLYLITPSRIDDLSDFCDRVSRALQGGAVAAVQIRLKAASDHAVTEAIEALKPIARAHGAAVIVNDRPDLAARLDCDGAHIGQQDGSVAAARQWLSADRILGVTCHDSPHLAMCAAEEGADYVAFGAFFPTTTKHTTARPSADILADWQETMLIPCVAIGGITVANCRPLVVAGADFLAVSAGVWDHGDGPAAAVRAFNSEIAQGLSQAQRT